MSAIVSMAKAKHHALLGYFVAKMSRVHADWRLTGTPSRSETRYELQMMAHLVWKAERANASYRSTQRLLADQIEKANLETTRLLLEKVRLLRGKANSPPYAFFFRDWIRPNVISDAALAALAEMRTQGDYADEPLSKTVQIMAFVFEMTTGRPATFSREPIGPVANGAQRTVGGSAFARFLLAFFAVVDPDLPASQISNMIERGLRTARRHPDHYKSLPNLL